MAMRSLSLLLLSFFLSITATPVAAQANDEAALLAFKAAVVGDGSALASWNSSSIGGFCSWEGVTCGGRHRRVVALNLSSHGLTGVLSPDIGNLSFLRILHLSHNRLAGHIPASLGRLRRLRSLKLSSNAFSGDIPINLTSCSSLEFINLSFNQLRGRVPHDLGNTMTRLSVLLLGNNSLTGSIPASLGNLSSLTFLDLSFNKMNGMIPPSLGTTTGLQDLELGSNHFYGEPPHSLYNLSSLQVLEFRDNMLHGVIPADIGSRFPNMSFLSFAMNQFTGPIPESISNLTTLQILDFNSNRLTGYVPRGLGRLQALQRALFGYNRLEANEKEGWEFISSMSNCSMLQQLEIHSNAALTGQIPHSIGNLSKTLQLLILDDTGISGSIPSAIGNLVGLECFSACNTSISGVIPESIGKLGNLIGLLLYNTSLSGPMPSSIGDLSKLSILFAFNSNLEGPLPTSLGKLTNLQALDLHQNHLNGSIPMDIFSLSLLSATLDLSYNLLSGPLPSEVGRLKNLNVLVLSGNQLYGKIPDSIGECIVLQELWLDNNLFEGSIPQSLNHINGLIGLNLDVNKLSGPIPNAIGTLHGLEQLYLAHNNLSGPIPTLLQNLTSLLELDLSFNNLQGEVPKEGIFKNLGNFSIKGNNKLCGGISRLQLPPCHINSVQNNKKKKSLTIALATIAALLVLAFVIVVFHLIRKKLRQRFRSSSFQPPIVEDHYERVSYHALESGTNGFSEANLLGQGTFGTVYKCTSEDEGTTTAVKVFNLEQSGSTKSFVVECEALRRVRHRSLIKIITCCSSINNKGQEFKALVFEFMHNGSLDGWIHPKSGVPATLTNTLSLEQRLDVAVSVVDALDYLHNRCEPPIVHCDLKPSNILLAEDMSARVGDFGISRILPESANRTLLNSNSTIGIRGSIGYVAPEYGEGSSVSTLGDVYSLGILLLEMFTGRSPTGDMFVDSLDLHKFAYDALPDRIWEIADASMWLHTDIDHSTRTSIIENCLVSVISLGLSCSKRQPRERAPTQDAAVEMHRIRDSYLKFIRSLVV